MTKPKAKRTGPKPLTPEQKEKVRKSLKTYRPIEWTEELIEEKRLALEEWISNPANCFLGSYLAEQGLHWEHLERFSKSSPKYCETLQKARSVQEHRLVTLALTRKHDGNFTKFVLANRAGWKEKAEAETPQINVLNVLLDRIGVKEKDPLEIDITPRPHPIESDE